MTADGTLVRADGVSYRLGRKVGAGLSSEVFYARDATTGLRVIFRWYRSAETMPGVAALHRQRIANYDGVAPWFATGEHGGRPFVIEADVPGVAFPGSPTPARWEAVIASCRSVCAILAPIHRDGWFHGNLKASKILVTPGGASTVVGLGRSSAGRSSGDVWALASLALDAMHAPRGPDHTEPLAHRIDTIRDAPDWVKSWLSAVLEAEDGQRPNAAESHAALSPRRSWQIHGAEERCTQQDLAIMFASSDRVLRLGRRAVRELWRRTDGDRCRVEAEVEAWVHQGLVRPKDRRLEVRLAALTRLEESAIPFPVSGLAWSEQRQRAHTDEVGTALLDGDLDRAAALALVKSEAEEQHRAPKHAIRPLRAVFEAVVGRRPDLEGPVLRRWALIALRTERTTRLFEALQACAKATHSPTVTSVRRLLEGMRQAIAGQPWRFEDHCWGDGFEELSCAAHCVSARSFLGQPCGMFERYAPGIEDAGGRALYWCRHWHGVGQRERAIDGYAELLSRAETSPSIRIHASFAFAMELRDAGRIQAALTAAKKALSVSETAGWNRYIGGSIVLARELGYRLRLPQAVEDTLPGVCRDAGLWGAARMAARCEAAIAWRAGFMEQAVGILEEGQDVGAASQSPSDWLVGQALRVRIRDTLGASLDDAEERRRVLLASAEEYHDPAVAIQVAALLCGDSLPAWATRRADEVDDKTIRREVLSIAEALAGSWLPHAEPSGVPTRIPTVVASTLWRGSHDS